MRLLTRRWLLMVWSVWIVLVGPGAVSAQTPTAGVDVFGASQVRWDIRLIERDLSDLPDIVALDIDGAEATAEDVQMLRTQGVAPICYFNAGAWEEWRSDADAYPAAIIGNAYPGWEGERFVDIRQLDVLGPILTARMDDCAAKGFAAVDPDNVDTYFADTGFPLTEADQLQFNRWLADEAHARGLAIGQKNVPDLTADLVAHFDFAVTEDCLVDGWCDQMSPYAEAGKPVLMIEYTDRDLSTAEICELAAGTFGSVVIKHRNLDTWSAYCT